MRKILMATAALAILVMIGCEGRNTTVTENREGDGTAADTYGSTGTTTSTDTYGNTGTTATDTTAGVAPDNTAKNREGGLTAGDQGESESDRKITQQIRAALTSDDTLSTTAQNVKIITVDGMVTLRGPVNDQTEKSAIASKAEQIAGPDKVRNELEVKGS